MSKKKKQVIPPCSWSSSLYLFSLILKGFTLHFMEGIAVEAEDESRIERTRSGIHFKTIDKAI